jgi:hypothetical protein
LWAFYRNGANIDVLLKRFPQLGPAKVLDALAFAFDNSEVIEADIARENQILGVDHSDAGASRGRQMALPFSGPDDT